MKVLNREVQPFVGIIIEKIEELNFRAREISLNSLISVFKHPKVEIKFLIDSLMEITEKGPFPDKAPWRIILGRLEILHKAILNFGVDPKKWDWSSVLQNLVIRSLLNANAEVRVIAIEIVLLFYQIFGKDIRQRI